VATGADAERDLRLVQLQLVEEDAREALVVVLASVQEHGVEPHGTRGGQHRGGLHEVWAGADDDEEVGHGLNVAGVRSCVKLIAALAAACLRASTGRANVTAACDTPRDAGCGCHRAKPGPVDSTLHFLPHES
jgi:hypothetical protein